MLVEQTNIPVQDPVRSKHSGVSFAVGALHAQINYVMHAHGQKGRYRTLPGRSRKYFMRILYLTYRAPKDLEV